MKDLDETFVCKEALRNLVERMDSRHLHDLCLKSGICPECGNEDMEIKSYGPYLQYTDYKCAVCEFEKKKSTITGIMGFARKTN
jgi:hypothetical protein